MAIKTIREQITEKALHTSAENYLPYDEINAELNLKIDTLFNNVLSSLATNILSHSFNNISLSKEVSAIHPFTLLEHLLSDDILKDSLKLLFKTHIHKKFSLPQKLLSIHRKFQMVYANPINQKTLKMIRTKILQSLSILLKNRHNLDHLTPHINIFCTKLNLNEEIVFRFILEEKFDELLKYIIFNQSI
jgi:hypothetical protein